MEQIDWLAEKGKITSPLKDMAHKIRLGGNRGAHPPEYPEINESLRGEDADAVIAFTKHYFEHIYVMPATMDKFDFSRHKAAEKKS